MYVVVNIATRKHIEELAHQLQLSLYSAGMADGGAQKIPKSFKQPNSTTTN